MATLLDKLTDPAVRPKVIRACAGLVEREVQSKSGLAGMAIKTSYKLVKAVRPGIVSDLVEALLPEWAEALEPLHAEAIDAAGDDPPGRAFETHLIANEGRAADALLSVTDRRAERAKQRTLKKVYDKLRGTALQHVKAAVPGLASSLAPFV